MPESIPEVFIVVLLGMVLGSFSSAIAYREAHNISWLFGKVQGGHSYRSVCPHCKHVLNPRDLVPLFSWLLLRGRCRYCQTPIGKEYPLIELFVLAGCLGIYMAYGLTAGAFYLYLSMPFLVALCAVDLKTMLLPNRLMVALGVLVGASLLWQVTAQVMTLHVALSEYVMGAVIYAALAWGSGFIVTKALRRDALGFGDVKLFAVAGLWLGIYALPWFCILSGISGVFLALAFRKKTFPFGPALILSLYALLLIKGSF